LSRLQEEYYELKRTGYAGEGFFSKGRRLGAGIPQTGPALIAQQRSIELEIAERRRANTVPGTNGPVRLGGGSLTSLGLTPRELAVLVRRGICSPRDMIISLSFHFYEGCRYEGRGREEVCFRRPGTAGGRQGST
jgi:hypothetical protein